MAPLQPTAFELRVQDPDDQTVDELVTVTRDGSAGDWLACMCSVMDDGTRMRAVVAPGDSPEDATKQLAKVLRFVADRLDGGV